MIRRFLTVILIYGIIGAASPYLTIAHPGARENVKQSLPTEEQIQVQGQLISLDVRDADLNDVLQVISQKTNIDLTLGEGVSGRVSIKLTEVTLEEALKNLCRSRALVYEYLPDKKAYRIIQAMAFAESEEKEGLSKAVTAADAGPGGNKAATSDSAGQQEKEIPAASPATKSGDQPGVRDSNGSGAGGNQPRPLYKPRELLVNFKHGVTEQQMADLHLSLGSTVLRRSNQRPLHRIKLREGLAEEEALGLYGATEIVEYVERHALRYPLMAPNDRDFPQQWGLVKIKAREAWDITRGSQEIVVAVIDTGVEYRHPDLQDNIWINEAELNGLPGVDDDGNGYVDDIRGWDFVGNDAAQPQPDNDPMDIYIHGTHVAGIVAARGNNGLGIAGLNWQLKLMPLKAMADNGTSFDDDAVSDAIDYAIAKGAKIVTCSFGGPASTMTETRAFTRLKNAGILAVCAAGNGDDQYVGMNTDLAGQQHYPSGLNLENILSVAASDQNDNLTSFSNYGLTSVDVMAPGADIYSTVPGGGQTAALIRTGGAFPVEYTADGMLFAGLTGENGITATAYDCGKGYPGEFPTGMQGYIALIERGSADGISSFTFAEKVRNAQDRGAVGVIVYNNVAGGFSGTLGSPGDWVPVVSLTQAEGAALKALGTPLVTLINKPAPASYDFLSGTSMAAPHVAGLAGLILAQCPALSYGEIKAAILDRADKIPAVAGKMVSGGRINAFATISMLHGDLSGNYQVGLEDAVLALRILSGLPPQAPAPNPSCSKDVNGDNEIGLPEALFILQKTAEMR